MREFVHRTLTGRPPGLAAFRQETRAVIQEWLGASNQGTYRITQSELFPYELRNIDDNSLPARQQQGRLEQSHAFLEYVEMYETEVVRKEKYSAIPMVKRHHRPILMSVVRHGNACSTLMHNHWYIELWSMLRSQPKLYYPGLELYWDPERFSRYLQSIRDMLRKRGLLDDFSDDTLTR